ncbi:MAG: trimeric intracellular cation channel family protein [Dialister sp.]|nr:trimeric intracellular cation channel family protein [Dialister sp.]
MELTWNLFEWLGTIAFAFSGTMVGIVHRMDIFGIVILAITTAVGGGMTRDVLAGLTPPTVLKSPAGLIMAVATAMIVSLAYRKVRLPKRRQRLITFFYQLSDTIGLAAFTVTGALMGLILFPDEHLVLPVALGLITAVGGGVIRDIMAQQIPAVLRADIYAVASIAGAIALCMAWQCMDRVVASWIGFWVTAGLRFCAIYYGWQLYRPIRRKDP